MSGVLSTMTPRGDRTLAPSRIQADARPDPGLLETVAAGFRTTYDEIGDVQENRLDDAYLPVVQALAERNDKRALDYRPSLGVQLINPFDGRVFDQEKIWKDIEAARAKDPEAFAELGKTRAEFEKNVLRREGGRDQDLDTLARGNAIAGFVGALPAAFRDPFNLATLPIGGVGKTIAGRVLSEGLVNAGIEALQTPAYIGNRANLGEETDAGHVALNIGTAFAGGMAIRGTIETGKIGLDKAMPGYRASREARGIELREVDGRDLVRAYEDAVPSEYRTPAEQSALDVLRRAVEIEEASPFPRTHAAEAVHEQKLAEAGSDLAMPRRFPGENRFRKPTQSATIRFVIDDLEGGGELVRDTGGLTRWGISEKGNPGVDIANLTRGAAEAIYRRKYWIPELAGLPQDAAIVAFDASVNHGPGFARRLIEAAGSDTERMLELRRAEYARLAKEDPAKYGEFSDGWENRLQKLEARLGREPGAAPASAFSVDDLAPQPRPDALDAERPIVAADGRPVPIEAFRAADIGVDAELMQFKSGGDAFGVTERLQGVTQWDPMAAGVVTVWEGADGRRLIADGHQRLGLAKRIMAQDPAQDIQVNAFVLREADGFTAQDARIVTALKNIGEGTGTASDAAKVFREAGEAAEEALAGKLPPRSALVRDGKALSRLHDEAFGAIVNEVIPEHYGAAIGHLVEDPDKHMAMVELLAQLDPPSRAQAEGILRQALAAGFTRETQEELFGGRELVSAIFAHKARVTEKVLAEVKKMKSAFQVAARNADALEGAGNKIARSESEAAAKANAEALALISRLAYRTDNEVSRILTDAAKRLAEGEPLARVVKDAIAQIQGVDLAAAVRAAAEPGDGPGGSGRDRLAESEDAEAPGGLDDLAPATRDELEAAGQLGFLDTGNNHAAFDDPHGQGVAAAADSMRHDIEAATPAPAREIPQYETDAQAGRPAAPVDAAADLDTILQHANVNQAELADFGRGFDGEGATWHDPGPKKAARITEKVENEGYAGAHQLKDIARGAISIERTELADEIVAALRKRFPEVHDKGWQFLPDSGYFDRKLIVTFEGGGRAELQIASQGLWDAKKNGGQDLYDIVRSLPEGDPRIAQLNAQQRELYSAALAGTPFEEMAARFASGKSSAAAASSSGTPSTRDLPTRAGADRQAPSSAKAQASDPDTATSRPSISNSDNFMGGPLERGAGEDPASPGNIGDNGDFVNVKGQDTDPAVADRQRQEMQLRADAPMRGANRTGQAQDGTMGLGLFDEADAPTFDLGDGQGPRSAADIFRELDEEAADIETIKACGLPGMGMAA